MARAYAGIATGVLPKLRFVKKIGDESFPVEKGVSLGLGADSLARLHEGMMGVTQSGTARGVFTALPFHVAGKTGTPEVILAKRLAMFRNNAWFCGFAPAQAPRLAFAVAFHVVPNKLFQGKRAAGVISDFLQRVYADPRLRRRYLGMP